jgi:hypothetical protein
VVEKGNEPIRPDFLHAHAQLATLRIENALVLLKLLCARLEAKRDPRAAYTGMGGDATNAGRYPA